MSTATVISFDLAVIAKRINANYTGEQADEQQAATLAERKAARRKAIADDLALVHANPPPEGFVAWVKANCPFTDRQAYRYLTEFDKMSNPTDEPKRKSKGGRPKGSKQSTTMMGWAQAAAHVLGTLPEGWTRNTIVQQPTKRAAIEAKVGQKMPGRNEKIEADGELAHRIAAVITELYNAEHGDEVIAQLRETLPTQTYKDRFDKAVAKAHAALQAQFTQEVYAEARKLAAQLAAEREQRAEQAEREAIEQRNLLHHERKSIKRLMTLDEYRLILGCLHPDRTEIDVARLTRAFTIMRRLETAIDPMVHEKSLQRQWLRPDE